MNLLLRFFRFGFLLFGFYALATTANGQGPVKSNVVGNQAAWPAYAPSRIYVFPFYIDRQLAEDLAKDDSLIPKGPVRKAVENRPRVTDAITGYDRNMPVGQSIAMQVAKNLYDAGLPVVYWNQPNIPDGAGWRLTGQIVNLDEGHKLAQNAIGFGVGNKKIALDVALSDPQTANGQPFFLLDTSDKGRRMPGTAPVAAVAGFNPVAVASKMVISRSGLKDSSQQHRLASEISTEILTAMKNHGQSKGK
ncbi:MAG: hypothetical protein RIR17_688 [Planctomycetota bacterium]